MFAILGGRVMTEHPTCPVIVLDCKLLSERRLHLLYTPTVLGICLNLVIGHSNIVRNVLDKMKATCLFFLNSPKRSKLL